MAEETDLIQSAWNVAELLAEVAGVEYRVVGVVYCRERGQTQPQPFSSQQDFANTIPGQLSAQAKELAQLRTLLSERDRTVAARDAELAELRAALQNAAPGELAAMDRNQAPPAQAATPAEPEAEEVTAAAAAETAAKPAAEFAHIAFLLEGMKGVPRHLRTIPLLELGGMPFDHFEFGEVKFKPTELQAMVELMVEGQTKTAVLKVMPGFNNNKYQVYSEVYKAIGQRIKPASQGHASGIPQPAQVAANA